MLLEKGVLCLSYGTHRANIGNLKSVAGVWRHTGLPSANSRTQIKAWCVAPTSDFWIAKAQQLPFRFGSVTGKTVAIYYDSPFSVVFAIKGKIKYF